MKNAAGQFEGRPRGASQLRFCNSVVPQTRLNVNAVNGSSAGLPLPSNKRNQTQATSSPDDLRPRRCRVIPGQGRHRVALSDCLTSRQRAILVNA